MTQFYLRTGAALKETDNVRVTVGKAGKSGHITRSENCPRCGGQGGSVHWRPDGGVCYQCRGGRTISVTRRVFTAERIVHLDGIAMVKEAKLVAAAKVKAAAKRIEFIAWAKPQGSLVGAILTSKSSFMKDLASKLRAHWTLSEKQMVAAANIVTQDALRVTQDIKSEFVGEIKERIEITATIEFTKEIEGYYGTTTIVKLRDDQGNVFTWFASGYQNLRKGDRVEGKGTVKKHDEYRGTKQTVLSRCALKVFNTITAEEAANQEKVS